MDQPQADRDRLPTPPSTSIRRQAGRIDVVLGRGDARLRSPAMCDPSMGKVMSERFAPHYMQLHKQSNATTQYPSDTRDSQLDYRQSEERFNSGPDLLVITDIARLRQLFVKYVVEASDLDLSRRRDQKTTTGMMTLSRVLEKRILSIDQMTIRDFVVAFTIFQDFSQHKRTYVALEAVRDALCLDKERINPVIVAQRWLKFVFCKLWNDQAVLFPLHFRFGSYLILGEVNSFLPRIATCNSSANDTVVAAFGLAVILASRWRTFSDVDLEEFAKFVSKACDDRSNLDALGLRRRQPHALFTSALKVWWRAGKSEGFRYSDDDIVTYAYWSARVRRGTTDASFIDFNRTVVERRREMITRGRVRAARRTAAAQLSLSKHHSRGELTKDVIEGRKSLAEVRLEMISSQVSSPTDILEYTRLLRSKGAKRDNLVPYPTRMQAYPSDVWVTWNKIFEEFFAYRRRRGFEHARCWNTYRRIFQDYLCCYLPWWQELMPDHACSIPGDPSEFLRAVHWTGYTEGTAPLSLLQFFDRIRDGKSLSQYNGLVTDTQTFFNFCRADAVRLGLRTQTFVNPVVSQLDRKLERKPNKTTKNPIATTVLPYLLRYAYACESFFIELAQRSLDGALCTEQRKAIGSTVRNAIPYHPSALGVDVGFDFDGVRHTLDTVPLLAAWEERYVRVKGKAARMAYLPNLSGLRMVIAALETGIRFQGIQWLCRKTYRSHVTEGMGSAELVPLVVSTDKVRDRPWSTLIVRRVYEMLLREERYQDLMADAQVERLVHYERRPNTRFAPVLPLFRGPQSEYPAGDRCYSTTWERLMVGFSLWHRHTMTGAAPLDMFRYEPEIDPQTKAPRVCVLVDRHRRRQYCPLRIKLRHTPHAARATFISARSGILPIEITGWLVGHTNTSTTYHYTVESEANLSSRLLAASNSVWSPDPSNPVEIRADSINSALRRSFGSDRLKTEAAFRMQTLSLLNADIPESDGVTLLRSTPMGQVAFRETHICPVGEMCPADVLDVIVEPRRCGVCPLAVKSVDHLPSIAAKMRHLLEQAREGSLVIERMRARGEAETTIGEVQYRRRLDVMEYEGWHTSLLALTRSLSDLGDASAETFHTGMPDAVRLHLKLVTRDAGQAEFVLQRIADSNGHGAFETPIVRAQAAQLRQRLLASPRALEVEIESSDTDPVRSFLSGLRLLLKAHGVAPTFQAALEAVRASFALPQPKSDRSLPDQREG